jgi:hypothetical protein
MAIVLTDMQIALLGGAPVTVWNNGVMGFPI